MLLALLCRQDHQPQVGPKVAWQPCYVSLLCSLPHLLFLSCPLFSPVPPPSSPCSKVSEADGNGRKRCCFFTYLRCAQIFPTPCHEDELSGLLFVAGPLGHLLKDNTPQLPLLSPATSSAPSLLEFCQQHRNADYFVDLTKLKLSELHFLLQHLLHFFFFLLLFSIKLLEGVTLAQWLPLFPWSFAASALTSGRHQSSRAKSSGSTVLLTSPQ